MRMWAVAAVAILSVFVVVGCSKPTVVGKWSSVLPTPIGERPAIYDFKEDHSLAIDLTYPVKGQSVAVTCHGTWQVTEAEKPVLEMRLQSLEAMGRSMNLPEGLQPTMGTLSFQRDAFQLGGTGNRLLFVRVAK
jgi:hypothetical protein